MTQFVALIRGIGPTNPNMRAEVLRRAFSNQGFMGVSSVLGTGNIIFSAPFKSTGMMESVIHDMLKNKLDLDNQVLVRDATEIKKLVTTNPFHGYTDEPTARLNITFLKKQFSVELYSGVGFTIIGGSKNMVYSTSDSTVQGTPLLMSYLEKTYGKDITTRTWKTIQKINAKLDT